MIFLKLGGSLITDKTQSETIRPKVLTRISNEIRIAIDTQPDMRLLLGHGSGSFGHMPAARYGTRNGVYSAEQWRGFVEVAAAAAKLTAIVRDSLLEAGVNVLSLAPHVSAEVEDGKITQLSLNTVERALEVGLVPMINGDVAFDSVRGGTIISTEEEMSFYAEHLNPTWLLLAGETNGVYDLDGNIIPRISNDNLEDIRSALGGSRGADVTGGMLSKVLSMVDLVNQHPNMSIRIFSGLPADAIGNALANPSSVPGTTIAA